MTATRPGHGARVLLLALLVGCGGRVRPAPGGGATIPDPPLSALTCGGVVDGSGSTPFGSFVAEYVHVRRCVGDCAPLSVQVVGAGSNPRPTFSFSFRSDPTGSFVGVSTMDAILQTGQAGRLSVSGWFEMTSAAPLNLTVDPGIEAGPFGSTTGTFSIHDAGVDVSGAFSSPVCTSGLSV